MPQRTPKRNQDERGLLSRAAKRAGVSLSMVSKVNAGKAVSKKVSDALAAERAAMRRRSR